jgi:phage tail P2-like protein
MSEPILLPGNTTRQERDIEAATARMAAANPLPIKTQWNPQTCPANLLTWLAWALNVDEWDAEWPEAFKRQTIAESIEVHRRKGTVDSIRRVLRNAGYGGAQIFEGVNDAQYDGTYSYNGFISHGETSDWAEYRVVLERPMTSRQAEQVRRILRYTAPARCDLVALNYTQVAHTYNGAIQHDGQFNHGTA